LFFIQKYLSVMIEPTATAYFSDKQIQKNVSDTR
jgi:hypothetical protein